MPSKSKAQHNLMEAVAHNAAFAKKVGIPQKVGKDFAAADKGKKFRKGGSANPTAEGINKQKTHHGDLQLPNASLNKYIGFSSGGLTQKEKDMKTKVTTKGMPALARNVGVKKAMDMPSAMDIGSMGMKKGGMAMKKMAMKKMAKGGETMGPRTMSKDVEKGSNKLTKFGESAVQKRGHTKGTNLGDSGKEIGIESGAKRGGMMKKYAKGGTVYGEPMSAVKTAGGKKPHGNGIAERGLTRANMPKMSGNTVGNGPLVNAMKKGGMAKKKYC